MSILTNFRGKKSLHGTWLQAHVNILMDVLLKYEPKSNFGTMKTASYDRRIHSRYLFKIGERCRIVVGEQSHRRPIKRGNAYVSFFFVFYEKFVCKSPSMYWGISILQFHCQNGNVGSEMVDE